MSDPTDRPTVARSRRRRRGAAVRDGLAAIGCAVLLVAVAGAGASGQPLPDDPYNNGTVTTTRNTTTTLNTDGSPDASGSVTLSALPVTGGDVVGMAILGLGTVALGSGLVLTGRRRRNRSVSD